MTLTLGIAKVIAHCEAVNGPVAVDARKALEEDDFEITGIWVDEKQRGILLFAARNMEYSHAAALKKYLASITEKGQTLG